MGIAPLLFAVVVVAGEEDADEPELVGLLAVGVVPVVKGVADDATGVVAAAGAPDPVAVEFKQPVELPVWTVNGALCEISPLVSRMVISRLVPTG